MQTRSDCQTADDEKRKGESQDKTQEYQAEGNTVPQCKALKVSVNQSVFSCSTSERPLHGWGRYSTNNLQVCNERLLSSVRLGQIKISFLR